MVGGRGKAGGIKLAPTPQAARAAAEDLLGKPLKGLTVHKVLIEEAVEIEAEIYLGLTQDRSAAQFVFLASSSGGIEIEEVARQTPHLIAKTQIHPLVGLCSFHALELAQAIQLPQPYWSDFSRICRCLLGHRNEK